VAVAAAAAVLLDQEGTVRMGDRPAKSDMDRPVAAAAARDRAKMDLAPVQRAAIQIMAFHKMVGLAEQRKMVLLAALAVQRRTVMVL
jgi:hypothetical protein